jgi:hypothetical protein
MPDDTSAPLCAVCSDPVDPDEAHWLHEPTCPAAYGRPANGCRCDQWVHPECCPEPDCQGVAT